MAADDAISLAGTDGTSYVKAEALALKSVIALIQGRKEDAARFARESFGADSRGLSGRIAMGQAALSMENADDCIRILEDAYSQGDTAANVSFMLGQALTSRGTERDINRAVEVFSTAKLDGLDRELIDPVLIGAVQPLVRAKRFSEIPKFIERADVAASAVMVATIKAYVAVKQSLEREAGQFLDAAIALRQPTDTRPVTDFLARTLMEAGRLLDALPLLQELFNSQVPDFDVGLLLNCASRLREDKVIMDTCQVLYERGERRWGS